MDLPRGLAVVAAAALGLSLLAFLGTLLAVEAARPAARTLVMVAYVLFVAGAFGLAVAAVAAAGSTVVRRVVPPG